MDPANQTPPPAQPANNLPTADGQSVPQAMPQDQASVQQNVQLPAAPEAALQMPAQPTASAPQTADPAATQAQDSAQASNAGDVSETTKNIAAKIIDDKDLIEKEYVDKARKIVEENRGDPYRQSEALTEFRAEYMQKEYNKTIKIDK